MQGRRIVVVGARKNVRHKLIVNQPFKHILEFQMGEKPNEDNSGSA